MVTMRRGSGLPGTPPKPMDLYPALHREEQTFWKNSPGAAVGEHWLPTASTVVHTAVPQLSPAVELGLERASSQFVTPPRQRAGVPVPIQSLTPTNGLAASASKAPLQIEAALVEAERELTENPNLSVAGSPAPAMCWLDAKIRSLRERGVKRTEQQMYLEELRRLLTGTGLPTQPSDTLFPEDGEASGESVWKRVASNNRQQMEWAYEHEELHRALSHLRRQQRASDDEREELRRLQEVECEGYLKDVEHAAEVLEEGSRRAKQAEEIVAQAKLRTEALEKQLQEAQKQLQEAQAEKQRISAGAALMQAELASAKEMSQKVVDNCRALQNRVKELEAERTFDRERHRRLESENHTLQTRSRELESRALELEARLRFPALPSEPATFASAPVRNAARSSAVAATSNSPASGRAMPQVLELCDAKSHSDMVLQSALATANNLATASNAALLAADEEMKRAAVKIQSIQRGRQHRKRHPRKQKAHIKELANSSSAVAMLPVGEPKALGPPAVASRQGKEADSIRSRIKELEREMTAVHQKTQALDGFQPAVRTQHRHSTIVTPTPPQRHTQPRRSSAPHFSRDEFTVWSGERPRSSSPARVPPLSLPVAGPLPDALESAAPSFAPLDSCDDEAKHRCHTFGIDSTDQVLFRS